MAVPSRVSLFILYTNAESGSRNCVPMTFTAESPLCPNIVDGAPFEVGPRKPRARISGALWRLPIGTDVVSRIYFLFQMCNRLPELMENSDAGIFPVYYSLKHWIIPSYRVCHLGDRMVSATKKSITFERQNYFAITKLLYFLEDIVRSMYL